LLWLFWGSVVSSLLLVSLNTAVMLPLNDYGLRLLLSFADMLDAVMAAAHRDFSHRPPDPEVRAILEATAETRDLIRRGNMLLLSDRRPGFVNSVAMDLLERARRRGGRAKALIIAYNPSPGV